MTRDDAAFNLRVGGMCTPTSISQVFIEIDRRALCITQIEIEDCKVKFPGEVLDFAHDAGAEPPPACPRRDKGAGQSSREGLRLIIARCPAQLRRAGCFDCNDCGIRQARRIPAENQSLGPGRVNTAERSARLAIRPLAAAA